MEQFLLVDTSRFIFVGVVTVTSVKLYFDGSMRPYRIVKCVFSFPFHFMNYFVTVGTVCIFPHFSYLMKKLNFLLILI